MPNRSPFLSLLTISSILFISSALVVKRECSPESRAFTGTCPDNINYVCAYFTGGHCDSGLCQKLATNECNACKDPSVEYYTAGLCESEKIYCDDKNRDLFPSCNDYSQACGYSTKGCFDGECALYSGYLCGICRDFDITYFKPGECPKDERVSQCSDYCDPSYQSPVCMMKAGCTGDDCTETYKDRCQGCQDYPNSIYKEGPCQKDRVVCDPDGNSADCDTVQDDPVCAYFRSFDYDNGLNLQQATVKNGCTACKDPAVNYYTPGECEFRWEDQRLCLPNHVEQECGDEDEPVCGYYSDNGVQNFPNSCSACQNNTIKFYRGGTCRNYCRTISTEEVEIIKCNGSLVEPVCTYEQVYSDDGNGNLAVIDTARYKTTSVRNSCAACFDIPLLDTVPPPYRDGLCPGDQGILCENEPTSFYYGSISPVCGLFDLRCSDSSCRKTFSEPLAACGYSMAVMYIPGYCPGDQGISCDLYRDQFRRVCEGMDTYRIPVCGYTRKDCNDDSCRANYQNQCYACSESSVTFFTKGACGN